MDERLVLYVGIDVGKRWHQAAFVGPDGHDSAKALRFANTEAPTSSMRACATGGAIPKSGDEEKVGG